MLFLRSMPPFVIARELKEVPFHFLSLSPYRILPYTAPTLFFFFFTAEGVRYSGLRSAGNLEAPNVRLQVRCVVGGRDWLHLTGRLRALSSSQSGR